MINELAYKLLTEGLFPNQPKVSKIILVFKIGCHQSCRSISLINTIGKLKKTKIVHGSIINYKKATKMLDSSQKGFKTGLSHT